MKLQWLLDASRIPARGKRTYQGVTALNLGAICKPLPMVDAALHHCNTDRIKAQV